MSPLLRTWTPQNRIAEGGHHFGYKTGENVEVYLDISGDKGVPDKYAKECSGALSMDDMVKKCIIMSVDNAMIGSVPGNQIITPIKHTAYPSGTAHAVLNVGSVSFKMKSLPCGHSFGLDFKAPKGYESINTIKINVEGCN